MAEKSGDGEKSAFDLMHQFDITPLAGLENTPLAFVTNSAFFMILTVAVIAVLMVVLTLSAKVVPGRGQTISEIIFDFGFGMVDDILGKKGRSFVTFLLSIFLFVFVANILGMMPYSFTVFSHISLTAFMAVVIFLMVIYVGVSRHGLKWFGIFAPAGVPGWLLRADRGDRDHLVLHASADPLAATVREPDRGAIVLKVIGAGRGWRGRDQPADHPRRPVSYPGIVCAERAGIPRGLSAGLHLHLACGFTWRKRSNLITNH